MFRPIAALAMLACGCALLGASSALAQDPAAEVPDIALSEAQPVTSGPGVGFATAARTSRLWATVNICDTATAPNSMGVRAGMPGNASGQRMFMRFRAEYWSRARQDWAAVAGSGVSPWVYAGPARFERRQAGWTFEFAPPPAGVTFTMRALVEFQWRRPGRALERQGRHSRVVRSITRATETGIRGVDGGDPAGTSKAMCLIY
jgi:hypothetical protein